MDTATRVAALASCLSCEADDLSKASWDDKTITYGREEYRVLTDSEADTAARESILESVWAFRPEFLAAHSGIDEDAIRAIQNNGKCESNNAVLLKLIDDRKHFVADAIRADGRGHFLSSYDNEECEVVVDGQRFYIYRIN